MGAKRPKSLVSNKLKNGGTDRAQNFWGYSHFPSEGLWLVKAKKISETNTEVTNFLPIYIGKIRENLRTIKNGDFQSSKPKLLLRNGPQSAKEA